MKSNRSRLMRITIATAVFMGVPFISGYANVYAQTSPEIVTVSEPATTATTAPTATPMPTSTPVTTTSSSGTIDYTADSATPLSATGEKVDGSATAVDYTYQGEKEFYSFKTKDGNTYYLIVDNEKSSDNVYFLTEINDSQLSVNSNTQSYTNVNQQPVVTAPTVTATTQTTQTPAKSNNTLLLVLLIFAIGGGAGYYFKIVKPKKAKATTSEDEGIDDEDLVDEGDEDYEEDGEEEI